jgi:copper(I)-binding protein
VNRALRAAAIGVLLLGPATLAACSAGQVNQTALQVRDKVGTTVSVGKLTLREVELAYPSSGRYDVGSDAVLQMAIVNESPQADTLVSIRSPAFQGVRVSGTGSQVSASLGPTAAPSQSTASSGAGTTAGTSAAGTSAAGTTATGTTATGTTGAAGASQSVAQPSQAPSYDTHIPIPGDSAVYLGQNAPHVTLVGLTQAVTPAQSLPVTFTFRDAGSVTMDVIVANPADVLPTPSTYDFEPTRKSGTGGVGG